VGLLFVLLILGSGVRVALLFLRPSAKSRFHTIRRRLLATRAEQGGDVLALFTAACMVLFGYHQHPGALVEAFWFLCLVAGFGLVIFAHDIARRYRPDAPGPQGPPDAGTRPSGRTRPPTPDVRSATGPGARPAAASRPAGTPKPPTRRPGPPSTPGAPRTRPPGTAPRRPAAPVR
jgi:hypothetical protein